MGMTDHLLQRVKELEKENQRLNDKNQLIKELLLLLGKKQETKEGIKAEEDNPGILEHMFDLASELADDFRRVFQKMKP